MVELDWGRTVGCKLVKQIVKISVHEQKILKDVERVREHIV